ncbi:DUF6602 domain-containing protein [Paenarthrobacter sp. NPDC090520]|uniref:DUF6602 domain-containing protein n=1 Tax=Paenarthrobacter sp. NPDC090520 TaxID=3364382 RepID=UPI0038184EB0
MEQQETGSDKLNVQGADSTETMNHAHMRWLSLTAQEMADDWDRIYSQTSKDKSRTQEGGKEIQTAWAEFLRNWLPPTYEVAQEKYIIGEVDTGDTAFETDIVVFRPGYPTALRRKPQVLAAGVAAAFSVKSTIRAASIEEATRRCAQTQRSLSPRVGSLRRELVRPFPYGLLAHSHDWKQPDSHPAENVSSELFRRDMEHAHHPRESIDLICVPDLGTWAKFTNFFPPLNLGREATGNLPADLALAIQGDLSGGQLTTAHIPTPNAGGGQAIAVFLTALYTHLGMSDPDLEALADSFSQTGGLVSGSANQRSWDVAEVLTEPVIESAATHTGAPFMNGENSRHFGSSLG